VGAAVKVCVCASDNVCNVYFLFRDILKDQHDFNLN